ncbi:hypothetical protein O3P69_010767 [Scylla paramamosain]|uniref:Monocarboxylate transporter n=1 Tax=Scylla paramamosain TaxID=85552 RepID=A0AAW0TI73_SCYPA
MLSGRRTPPHLCPPHHSQPVHEDKIKPAGAAARHHFEEKSGSCIYFETCTMLRDGLKVKATPHKVRCSSVPAVAVVNRMGAHTYEEDPVTSPLGGVEPGLTLGTIEEAKEGSTGDESEAETIAEPPQDETTEVTEGGEEKKEELEEQEDEEEKEEEELDACLWESHPDVDRGWAWVILIAMFGVFVITSGLLSTTGMFYVQMLGEYGHSRSYTAWMGSLINAFFMLGGPMSFMFIQTFGCRAAIICGSLIMAAGYMVSAFTTSLEALFFTYGVVVASKLGGCRSFKNQKIRCLALAKQSRSHRHSSSSTLMVM